MSGKGSTPRPFAVTQDEYGANWAATFGKTEAKDHEWKTDALPVVSSSSPEPRSWRERLSSWLASFRQTSG